MLSFDWLSTQTCTCIYIYIYILWTVNCALLWVWLFCFEFQWLGHVSDMLWASLSGSILQTWPELDMPLKGHSLSPHSCPLTLLLSAPSEWFGYTDKTVEVTWHKHKALPPWVKRKKSSILIQNILVVFVLAQTIWAVIKEIPDIFQLCVTNLLLSEHQWQIVC